MILDKIGHSVVGGILSATTCCLMKYCRGRKGTLGKGSISYFTTNIFILEKHERTAIILVSFYYNKPLFNIEFHFYLIIYFSFIIDLFELRLNIVLKYLCRH